MLSTVPLSSQQIFARHFLLRAKVPHILACFCYCSCGEIDRMDIVTSRIGIEKCRAPKSRPGQDNWSTVDPRYSKKSWVRMCWSREWSILMFPVPLA